MSSRINNYSELVSERKRLEALLQAQRELIRADVQELKAELKPVQNAINMIGKLTKRDTSNPLLTGASDLAIDLLIKRVLLAKAGWITRLVVPFFTKNLSSHVLADYKDAIFSKISEWLAGGEKEPSKSYNDQPFAEEKKMGQD